MTDNKTNAMPKGKRVVYLVGEGPDGPGDEFKPDAMYFDLKTANTHASAMGVRVEKYVLWTALPPEIKRGNQRFKVYVNGPPGNLKADDMAFGAGIKAKNVSASFDGKNIFATVCVWAKNKKDALRLALQRTRELLPKLVKTKKHYVESNNGKVEWR